MSNKFIIFISLVPINSSFNIFVFSFKDNSVLSPKILNLFLIVLKIKKYIINIRIIVKIPIIGSTMRAKTINNVITIVLEYRFIIAFKDPSQKAITGIKLFFIISGESILYKVL